jgi:hypothetical protein
MHYQLIEDFMDARDNLSRKQARFPAAVDPLGYWDARETRWRRQVAVAAVVCGLVMAAVAAVGAWVL